MNRTTRKTLTTYGALHPKCDIGRLFFSKTKRFDGRGLISTEMCVRSEVNNLSLHVRGSNEMLLKGVKKVGIVKPENLMEKNDFKKNSQNEFKNKWHEKEMHGQFAREIPEEIDKDLSRKLLCKVTSK